MYKIKDLVICLLTIYAIIYSLGFMRQGNVMLLQEICIYLTRKLDSITSLTQNFGK